MNFNKRFLYKQISKLQNKQQKIKQNIYIYIYLNLNRNNNIRKINVTIIKKKSY